MKQIPPHLLKQLQASGIPFPGGLQMPPGMRPPMGMQMPPQQAQASPPNKARHNPLPTGPSGLKTMKAFAQCPVLEDADVLNKLIERLLEFEEAEEFTEITEKAGNAIAVLLQSDRACKKYTTRRNVVTFSADKELEDVHNKLLKAQGEVEHLQKELSEAVQLMQSLMQKRWETAVKNFGLNPEKNFYTVNENTGSIDLVQLECQNCKGRTRVRDMRTSVAQQVLELGERKTKKENNNDGTREGNAPPVASERDAEDSREVSNEQQKVQSMADSADTNGGNGDNSAGNTT